MLMGMSWSEAMALPASERIAWLIALGESRGGVWNTETKKWNKPPHLSLL